MNLSFLTSTMIFIMFLTGINFETKTISPAEHEITAPVRTIVLNSNDQMKFDKTEIRVKAGEKIKLVLKHTGKLPKNAMGHNFVLLAKGTDVAKFATAAMNDKATEYIPAKGVLAHTK
ncbi:MAG TPA: plastocyanin/azurin family copper-binding protein, partial [Gillisia sp.]|nr:plastocyanin/azurin family copper-binding protein [Gillisia sp.]